MPYLHLAFLRSALPCAKHLRAVGARTGRALQNCCAHTKGEANEVPVVAEPKACALCQWLSRLRTGPATNGKAIGEPFARGAALVAAHAARGPSVGKPRRNGCDPRAAATRKMRVVPVAVAKMAAPHVAVARDENEPAAGRSGSLSRTHVFTEAGGASCP